MSGETTTAATETETESPGESGTATGGLPPGNACSTRRPVEIDGGCYPEPRAYSFHLIHREYTESWDAIGQYAAEHPEILLTSQNKPRGLDPLRWAQRTSPDYHASGSHMAKAVHEIFVDDANAPAVVLVDELRGEHIHEIAEFAATMRTEYPQWAGRWGIWLVHGLDVSYAALQPAVDELFRADATFVPELYPAVSQYCSAGATTTSRDAWLTAYFRGGEGAFEQPRFRWLVDRREELKSSSRFSLAFGVTETYLDRPGSAAFLDRMFFVWRAHSGFGSLLFPSVGGVGAYKWHDHGPTTRDTDFVNSYAHYATAKDPASRLGAVPCD